MERMCMTFLTKWLYKDDRIPLLICGARQVGKTWVVNHLAQTEGKRLITVDFERRPELHACFKTNNPKDILFALEMALGIAKIDPDECILFLDEIQAMPQMYAKLRWFKEKMQELPVIATESLLHFALINNRVSAPVGRVTYMYLEPLSFEEFLLAKGRNGLVRMIHTFTWDDEIPQYTHDKLIELFKEYVIIGGMPAAVKTWLETESLQEVRHTHQEIVNRYRADAHRYCGRIAGHLVDKTLDEVPLQLGKKFIYSRVNKKTTTATLRKVLASLSKARVCHSVPATDADGLPLGGGTSRRYSKTILVDVGLYSTALDLPFFFQDEQSLQEGIAEQVVGQLLRTIRPFYMPPKLYYWLRDTSSSAEVDYVTNNGPEVLPIEVKPGAPGMLRSLHTFMDLKKRSLAARIYSDFPKITNIEVKNKEGKRIQYELRSIPFYLVGQLPRLVN